jgi:hypothetical protein
MNNCLIIFYFIILNLFLISSIASLTKINKNDALEVVIKVNRNLQDEVVAKLSTVYNFKFKQMILNDYFVFETNLTNDCLITTANKSIQLAKRSLISKIINKNERQNLLLSTLDMKLKNDSLIEWHEIQKSLKRTKRSYFQYKNKNFHEFLKNLKVYLNKKQNIRNNKCKKYSTNDNVKLNDPEWTNQWYLNEECLQGFNLNITQAWRMGFTGRNVVVCIIDDGLEKNNTELLDNYDAAASFDLNDYDFDPQPRYDRTNENKHGTRCAGEIAAKANNSVCGVGVAFNCRIGGIRLLDGRVTDRLEAEALNFNINYIDIFSASWGPLDDGKTVDGPGVLAKEALIKGITNGRNGKGKH